MEVKRKKDKDRKPDKEMMRQGENSSFTVSSSLMFEERVEKAVCIQTQLLSVSRPSRDYSGMSIVVCGLLGSD